jgi:hypothetical protein
MTLFRAYDEVVSFFANAPTREEIATFQLSRAATMRIQELLRKSSADTLTADEANELEQCAQLDQLMMLIRSRARQQKQTNKTA